MSTFTPEVFEALTCGGLCASSNLNLGTLSDISQGLNTWPVATSFKNGRVSSTAARVPSNVYEINSLSDVAVKLAPTSCILRMIANWLALRVDKPAAILNTCATPTLSGVSLREPALTTTDTREIVELFSPETTTSLFGRVVVCIS